MEALAVNPAVLKAILLPEVKLTVGRELMARVAAIDVAAGRGTISLAGVMLEAELPRMLQVGQEIRLAIKELTPERVVLQLQENPAGAIPPPPEATLPGGGTLQVTERDGSPAQGGASPADGVHSLTLRYDAPALGPVDMRFLLGSDGLRLQVTTAAGAVHAAADEASDELRRALGDALGMPVSVTVAPRYDPLDVYA